MVPERGLEPPANCLRTSDPPLMREAHLLHDRLVLNCHQVEGGCTKMRKGCTRVAPK